MNYEVVWVDAALEALAGSCTTHDRQTVTDASTRIDRLLERDPINVGEGRDGEDRILFEPPLKFWFQVDSDHRIVWVLSVGTIRR